jgi:hypothetical protein
MLWCVASPWQPSCWPEDPLYWFTLDQLSSPRAPTYSTKFSAEYVWKAHCMFVEGGFGQHILLIVLLWRWLHGCLFHVCRLSQIFYIIQINIHSIKCYYLFGPFLNVITVTYHSSVFWWLVWRSTLACGTSAARRWATGKYSSWQDAGNLRWSPCRTPWWLSHLVFVSINHHLLW